MKRYIPSIFTGANALCGFFAIIATLDGSYAVAAWFLVLAAFMDAVDGRSARYLGMSTAFGKELDALADAISFCVTPAVILYAWHRALAGGSSFFLLVCLSVYICAGLFRLARFNTMPEDQSFFFIGLPTPMGAFFLVQLVVYQQWLERSLGILTNAIVLGMVVLAIAGLFVSRISFFAFKKISQKWKSLGMYLVGASTLVFCGLCGWAGYPVFLLITTVYVAGNIVWWAKEKKRVR